VEEGAVEAEVVISLVHLEQILVDHQSKAHMR
jgi:hypothetical protein